MHPSNHANSEQARAMQNFYRWQAGLYDATRWAFLFGRRRLQGLLPQAENLSLAEIGCGTGWNLLRLAKLHPNWHLTGIDVSPDMLHQAGMATATFGKRVQLLETPYGAGSSPLKEPVDLVLFSYSLTMFNPGWEGAIEQAWQDLKPGGHIAVVDFHDTQLSWLERWMTWSRVRMDGHLLPFLESRFEPVVREVASGYGFVWRYFLFIGRK